MYEPLEGGDSLEVLLDTNDSDNSILDFSTDSLVFILLDSDIPCPISTLLNEPLEGVNSLEVLLDSNDSDDSGLFPGFFFFFEYIHMFFLSYFSVS